MTNGVFSGVGHTIALAQMRRRGALRKPVVDAEVDND